MIWDILLGLYLLGAAITFIYIWGKSIRACIRVAFGFKPQYKIWVPFNVCRNTIFKNLLKKESEYFGAILNTLAWGGMFSIIYPIYLPIYFVRQPIKTFIKTLAYKIVTTKEEKVQRALGTDCPEKPEKDNMAQRNQAISGSYYYMFLSPPQSKLKWKWKT